MKKDKIVPNSISITEAEPAISSATITLQLLAKEKEKNKEAEKKEVDEEKARVRCKVCFREVAPKRLCSGHGSGGGGGSAVSDKTSDKKFAEAQSLSQPHKFVEAEDEMLEQYSPEALYLESGFDPEIIAELIAKGLLLVDCDRESKTITIKLLCELKVLTKEQKEELKKFLEAVIKEFHTFQKENNLANDCIKTIQDREGNTHSLRITLPTLILFDAFIQRLATNLVPIPSLKAQSRDEVTKDRSHSPNPFSMEPQLAPQPAEQTANKKDEQSIFNPSPFNIKPW
ncbi:Uncharacterised protein (plasmid) [Legionella adelaidensis]|uniref:Uncharacterized protein n=1 Tax=Legionella adelaidensis TaxID=45056 RepID=A0A0W0R2B5_9GAMM|nr:hypothetical protein [Legionella adelaidensis]KTC65113.1 hypothetical protein Lade_1636 [Legionella adelaidensis]VEH85367.1 Uncharacterised protein [Legionella adelaidensis]